MTVDEDGVETGPIDVVGQVERALANLDVRIRHHLRGPHNPRVGIACTDALLAARFVVGILRPANVSERIKDAVRADGVYAAVLGKMEAPVKEFDAYLGAIGQQGSDVAFIQSLTRLADDLRNVLDAAVVAFVSVISTLPPQPSRPGRKEHEDGREEHEEADDRDQALAFSEAISNKLHVRRVIREIEVARDETRRVRDEAKMAAGEAVSYILGNEHGTYAKEEKRTADVLRWVVGGLLVVVAIGALGLYGWTGAASPSAELVRLSATLPIVALATYLARESNKHRIAARKARELAVEMRALPAYTEQLEGDDRRGLYRTFGTRVFGATADPPATVSDESGVYTDLTKVMEILGQVRSAFERRTNQ